MDGRAQPVALACLCALTLGLAAVATAAAASTPKAKLVRCERAQSTTLLESRQVRLYSIPTESAHIVGAPVFGCYEPTGKSRLLRPPSQGAGFRYSVEAEAFGLSGPVIAYAVSGYGTDFVSTWVQAVDVRSGRLLRSCLAGGVMAPHPGLEIPAIVVKRNGSLGWSAAEPLKEASVDACDSTRETRVLETSDGIDLRSLLLQRSVLHWSVNGEPREAALE
jgi:hypothetical protein